MNIKRIFAVFLQEVFLTIHSVEIINDILFFPLINVVVFGFLSLYLIGNNQNLAGEFVLLGMLLWQVIWIVQYSICVGSLFNIWGRNLSNMFIAPLLIREYIFAHTLSGVIKAIVTLVLTALLSIFVFHFDLFSIGILSLILIFITFTLFAFAIGIAMLGLIFRYGTMIQALAWGVVPIFQPLSGAFYPISVMPLPLQYLAYLFPPTYAFEAARYSLMYHMINWQLFGIATIENGVYCILGSFFFRFMFRRSRSTGQFARNEA